MAGCLELCAHGGLDPPPDRNPADAAGRHPTRGSAHRGATDRQDSPVPPPVLARGSFPELWSRPEIAAGEFHRSYVSTYLERDLRSLQQVGNLQQFERFLRASALRSGQLLNRAELARSPLVGAVWETFVVGEVQRQLELAAAAGKLHFWRDRSKEVDLVLERGGRFWLGDAKWTELPSSRDGRRLRQVADELPPGVVASTALICRTPHRFPLGDGLEALPLAELGPHWNLG